MNDSGMEVLGEQDACREMALERPSKQFRGMTEAEEREAMVQMRGVEL